MRCEVTLDTQNYDNWDRCAAIARCKRAPTRCPDDRAELLRARGHWRGYRFCDRVTGIGFGYVSNLLSASMANEKRAISRIAALKAAIGVPS